MVDGRVVALRANQASLPSIEAATAASQLCAIVIHNGGR